MLIYSLLGWQMAGEIQAGNLEWVSNPTGAAPRLATALMLSFGYFLAATFALTLTAKAGYIASSANRKRSDKDGFTPGPPVPHRRR
jgi:hypothetical protein